MNTKPMLFNADMVRALLGGRKVQTRRPMKDQPENHVELATNDNGEHFADDFENDLMYFKSPFGQVGDLMWVRETWQLHCKATDVGTVVYKASIPGSWTKAHEIIPVDKCGNMQSKPFQEGWRPSIHMPRWASRLSLPIVNIRVERVQDISEEDAIAEGIDVPRCDKCGYTRLDCLHHADHHLCGGKTPDSAAGVFNNLWNSIYNNWDDNPWVFVYDIEVIHKNVDDILNGGGV